jgi:hypothetical protein
MKPATADTETAAVRAAKSARDAAEVALLQSVVTWSAAHRVEHEVVTEATFGESGVLLGGVGCPLVSEFDVYDLAATLGMSSEGGCSYVARTLELRYRLPKAWEQVVALRVPVWKAFKVADATMGLCWEAARYVDTMLAPVLHSCSFAQIERTVAVAIDQHDPEEAERRRVRAADGRRFDVHLGNRGGGTDGTVEVSGTLDTADALDLEQAVRQGAKTLGDLGCEEPLDVRRSMAVGEMARNQLALDLSGDGDDSVDTQGGRGVTIYAHTSAGQAHADVDNPGAGTVLVSQLLEWCTKPGVFVKIVPVIDLNTDHTTPAYVPTPTQVRQVRLRDQTCVFSYCTKPAERCDLDHRVPFDKAHPDQGGPTASSNLTSLCRRHHRAKTFSTWSYDSPSPGAYEWTSPTGARFTVTRGQPHGRLPITNPLDPPDPDPPPDPAPGAA